MSHNIISAALESRLLAWAKARTKPLKVVVENETYTPASGETYLRAFTLPAVTTSNTLGGDHHLYVGVFQVNIVAPSGKYRTEASGIVDELAALFGEPAHHSRRSGRHRADAGGPRPRNS